VGRRCRRKLGNGSYEVIDIFLLPFYLFKWAFSLVFWWYLLVIITSTDAYYDVADKLKDKWYGYREK